MRARVAHAAAELDKVGLRTAAALVAEFGAGLGGDPRQLIRRWVHAQVWLLTSAELS